MLLQDKVEKYLTSIVRNKFEIAYLCRIRTKLFCLSLYRFSRIKMLVFHNYRLLHIFRQNINGLTQRRESSERSFLSGKQLVAQLFSTLFPLFLPLPLQLIYAPAISIIAGGYDPQLSPRAVHFNSYQVKDIPNDLHHFALCSVSRLQLKH